MQQGYQNSKQKLLNAIANVIKNNRSVQNKSISKISAEILMSKSMWADLEKGIKDPQFSTIWRICEALELPFESFVREIKLELGKDFTLIV